MLNCLCRLAASPARTRALRWAPPLAFVWMLAAPMAHAAERTATPPERGGAVASSFDTYQNWRDEPLHDWTKSNARVGEIGGWMTYLRDARQGDGSADTSGQGHQGHHGH